MSKRNTIILIFVMLVVVVGLSVYLIMRQSKSASPVQSDVVHESEVFDKYAGNMNVAVGRIPYGNEGFDRSSMKFEAPQGAVLVIPNLSDSPLQLEFVDAPIESTQTPPVIPPGSAGEILLEKPGVYNLRNAENESQTISLELLGGRGE